MAIFPLVPRIQRYDWGSPNAIPDLFRIPNRTDEPIAELWMGAHPSAPSLLRRAGTGSTIPAADAVSASEDGGGSERSLDSLLTEQPAEMLGGAVVREFGGRLPYLLKILSADRALSIQAHPSLEQARAGFRRENSAGIELDARNRNYKDDNHKPELLCAVTDFWVMRGFRTREELIREFCEHSWPIAAELRRQLLEGREEETLTALLHAFLAAEEQEQRRLIERALERADEEERESPGEYSDPRYYWVVELARQFPNDIGVLAPLYLNTFRLAPGQATYLDAGVLHAYLRGTGIEIMANSNNVLRGGLTSKHVDVPELLKTVSFKGERPNPIEAEDAVTSIADGTAAARELLYRTPAPEFELRRIELSEAVSVAVAKSEGPEIFLCTEGTVEIGEPAPPRSTESAEKSETAERTETAKTTEAAEFTDVSLSRGQSVFLPAACREIRLSGTGVLYRATCPAARSPAEPEHSERR